MHVTLLGTMGWMPSDHRETTCFACRLGESLFVFDAGTGLRRLLAEEQQDLLTGARDIHLFLSHFHLDHTCGLAYLSGVLPGQPVTIHAPGAGITGLNPETVVAGLLRKPYNPTNWEDLAHLRVEPLVTGVNHVAGHDVRVRPQKHSDTSVAFRVDDDLVIATDTAADPATAEFAAGASLLLHEAWYWAADPHLPALPAGLRTGTVAHSEAGAVAGLAATADVGRLVLVHLNPLSRESSFAAMHAAAAQVFPRSELHADGTTLATNPRV